MYEKGKERIQDDLNLLRMVQNFYKIKSCLTVMLDYHRTYHNPLVMQ